MQPTFVFSGTFDPPTYGHVALLQEASLILPNIIIVCSDHSAIETKFSQEERVILWQSYALPQGVVVETFDDFMKRHIPGESIVLIRGLRSETDGAHEARVLLDSAKNAHITKTFTLLAPDTTAHISSSKVWDLASQNTPSLLEELVNATVAAAVLEKRQQKSFS